MAVFKDETGRRGRVVKLGVTLGAAALAATAGVFVLSLFAQSPPEPPAAARSAPHAASEAEVRAREAAYRRDEAELKGLMASAERAQRRRPAPGATEPVLAGFAVNWDPLSAASLARHKDALTHVMPEWIRVQPDGELAVEENAKLLPPGAALEVLPMVQNYADNRFQRSLALAVIARPESRRAFAHKLLELCHGRGWAGVNLDFEGLEPRDGPHYAALVEAVWAELHPKGFLVTVDVPADPGDLPAARIAAASDFVIVMAYDQHYATGLPGPISTPGWVSKWVLTWLKLVPSTKVVVALAAYGLDWELGANGKPTGAAQPLSFEDALVLSRENEVPIDWDARGKTPSFEYDDDETHEKHQVHFVDAPAAAAQLLALRDLHLRGAAVWRLGAEDPKLFKLFAPPPAPREFDPKLARENLDGVIPHDVGDVSILGAGEILRVRGEPQPGAREVEWDAQGQLAAVRYKAAPSGWILERRGGKPAGKIALTFDDGPDPRWTPQILDILKARGLHATFFLIGQNAQAYPGLVRRILAEGNMIGNHSFTHPDLGESTALRERLELTATTRLFEWITGLRPTLLRPPYHTDRYLDSPQVVQVIARAQKAGYITLGEDIDPEDWSQTDPDEIVKRVLADPKNGSVLLLHDGGGDRGPTVAALPRILDGFKAAGIRVADIEEVTGLPRAQLLPAAPPEAVIGADGVVFAFTSALRSFFAAAFLLTIGLLALRSLLLLALAPIQRRRARKAGELPPTTLSVSVVVPAYNEEAVIARTVQSLLEQEPPVLEVVCVDDGSTDATLRVLRDQFGDNARVRIFGKPNGGKASALNFGFHEARGELVVALDSDTVFAPDTVARLCAPFGDAKVGAVAGNAKVGNRVNRLTRWQALEYVTAQNLERRAWDLIAAVPVVPGAVGAWRRSAVLAAGGFHEDTLAEDTDLTLRLIAAGHRVVYAERALAWTEAPEAARGLLKQRFRWTYGVLQACWKHKGLLFHKGGGPLGWLILPAFAIYQFLVPFLAPVVDALLIWALASGHAAPTLGLYLLFFALDLVMSALAILLEGEDLALLLGLFVQRIAYRQLLWVALMKSLWSALVGFAVGWGKLQRTGSVQAGPNG